MGLLLTLLPQDFPLCSHFPLKETLLWDGFPFAIGLFDQKFPFIFFSISDLGRIYSMMKQNTV